MTDPLIPAEAMLDQTGTDEGRGAPTPEELASQFKEDIQEHETECNDRLDSFRKYDQLWRCIPTEVEGVEKDEIFSEESTLEFFRECETVHANVLGAIFGEQLWFQISSGSVKQEDAAADWTDVLSHQLREMPFRPSADIALRSLIINGTEVVGTPWQFAVRWNEQGKDYVRDIVKDGPGFEPLDLVCFHRQPGAVDIEPALWVSEERDVTAHDARAMLASAKTVPGAIVDSAALEKGIKESSDANINKRKQDQRTDRGYGEVAGKGMVHLDIRWSCHPGNEKSPIVWKFVTINRRYVFIQCPNPFAAGFKPYLKACFIPLKDSFYGHGIGDILWRAAVEMNAHRALMRTKFMLDAYGMWMQTGGVYDPDAAIRPRPGGVMHSSRWGSLTPLLVTSSAISTGFQFEQALKEDMRAAVVANAVSQAQPLGTTAREVSELVQSTMKRVLPTASQIAESLFRPFLQRMIEMNQQWMPKSLLVYILGPDGAYRAAEIMKMDLPGIARAFIKMASDLDFTAAIQRRLTSFLQMMVQAREKFPEIDEEGFTAVPYIKKLTRTFGENPNEVFSKDLKRARLISAIAQAKMRASLSGALAGAPGGGPEAAGPAPLPPEPAAPPPVPRIGPELPPPEGAA